MTNFKLLALFVTLIVLLILAGVSLSGLFSEKGLFNRAENASNRYNEAKAREVLETVLLADGQYEKNTNQEYNQDEFLDELIKSEIPGSDVKGDVAIIGEYAYELDRSVPKIGTGGNNGYLGMEKDLIFPDVTVAEITQADASDNYRTAKIEITATINQKAENGINRIDIWQNGIKLNTITCNNEKTITTEYRVNRNGIYTIKAYSKISNTEMHNAEISGSARTTVEGIVPAVEFSPNGNTTYQKAHTTTVKVKETAETVTEMKYLWKKADESEPQVSEFKDTCINNSSITGQGEKMTGEYYLWVLVKLEEERTYTCRSEKFKFDNRGPTITSVTVDKYSADGITVNIVAEDTGSGISRLEIYIDNEQEPRKIEKLTNTVSNISENIPVTGLSMGEHTCKAIVYDDLENNNFMEKSGTTMLHSWKKSSVAKSYSWVWDENSYTDRVSLISSANTTVYVWTDKPKNDFKYDSTWSASPVLPEGYKTASLGNLTSGTGVSLGKRFYVFFNLKLYLCESDAVLEHIIGSTNYWLRSSTRKNIYNQQNRKNNRKTELMIMELNIVLKEMHIQTTIM